MTIIIIMITITSFTAWSKHSQMDIERKTNRVLCTKMYINSDELGKAIISRSLELQICSVIAGIRTFDIAFSSGSRRS